MNSVPQITETERSAVAQSFERLAQDERFVEISGIPGVAVDLRYAQDVNFMNQNVYGKGARCFLHRESAEMLKKAAKDLLSRRADVELLILDGLRPASAQKILWAFVVGTDQEKYVANPAKGSLHSYGLAVDLTLRNSSTGQELDMGTGFDEFDRLSEPRHEDEFFRAGRLTSEQLANRHLLRAVMTGAGFQILPHEWWHFDAFPPDHVRANYQIAP